jgi:short-subunit dehydrogenase
VRRFIDKTVIITGASAGIGEACARRFAAEGANLVLVARGASALDGLVAQLRRLGPVTAAPADVTDARAMAAVLERAVAEYGNIHVLVNNAGCNVRGPLEELAADQLARIVDVNLRAPILLSRMVLPYLRRAGSGAIVNVASLAGRVPLPHEATYSATKFGLRAFSTALAEELRGSGITVSAVSPGPVDTGFIMEDLDAVPDIVFSQPMSSADEIAGLVLDSAADGRLERMQPRVGGYLATAGYLLPQLARVMRPLLEARGRRAKERYRSRSGRGGATKPT